MSAICFVDTNLLVYFHDRDQPEKRELAARWMRLLWRKRAGRTSFQVLNEFYVTVTRKLSPGLEREQARRVIRDLILWRPTAVDAPVLEGGWALQDRYSLSWWDALIVSAAQRLGCSHLLSEDLRHDLVVGDLRIANPFLVEPEGLFG